MNRTGRERNSSTTHLRLSSRVEKMRELAPVSQYIMTCTWFVRPLSRITQYLQATYVTNATAYPRIEYVPRNDEVHSSDETYGTCECVITGLGFQKEMTHPLDDEEKTMNTYVYICILCVYKHLPRGPMCNVGDVPVYKMPFIILYHTYI